MRQPPRHRPPRSPRHDPAHPRSDAAALEDGGLQPPAPARRGRPQPAGVQGRHRQPHGGRAAQTWSGSATAAPAWGQGGSYQVVRHIRMLVEFWDRVSLNEQENMFGRRRDSGAPLDGNDEFDTPNYHADPQGDVIPLDSHIRLANPRTPPTAKPSGCCAAPTTTTSASSRNGTIQAGHIFTCYQQDVQRQFETVQTRLINEPLVDYVQPFGGGYFYFCPASPTTATGTSDPCSPERPRARMRSRRPPPTVGPMSLPAPRPDRRRRRGLVGHRRSSGPRPGSGVATGSPWSLGGPTS